MTGISITPASYVGRGIGPTLLLANLSSKGLYVEFSY